jgi:hypothetical protein
MITELTDICMNAWKLITGNYGRIECSSGGVEDRVSMWVEVNAAGR